MVEFRGLTVRYRRGPTVVEAFDLRVEPGRILAVLGPSGCGKTTLLRAAAGLVTPTTPGVIWSGSVEGRVPDSTAVIFQDLGLLPWKTVEDNVGLPLKWRRSPDRRARTAALLAEFGLEAHAQAWPGQLSGGLAQRTAIARALALRPQLLLMDEPFSALDALTRERAQQTLYELWQSHGPTVVLVTHSVEEAAALGHQVAVLTGTAPGRLAALVTPNLVEGGPGARRADPRFYETARTLRAALEAPAPAQATSASVPGGPA